MPYELTQIRMHLQRFMKEIGDVLTSPEDISRYEDFSSKMKKLSQTTELHYKNKIPLVPEIRNKLRQDYSEAMEAAAELIGSPDEAGAVSQRMKTIAREMLTLMQMDVQALDLIVMKKNDEGKTLPELLGEVRTQAADLGDAEGPANREPMQIRVETADDIQTGVFTPASPGSAQKPAAAYSRLAGILGKPDLVTRVTPMLLMHRGGSTAGTFIPRAAGIDPAQIQTGDPFLSFGVQNLDTAAGISGTASMNLMDLLVGAAPHDDACSLRFDPPYSTKDNPAQLVGLSVKPDGISFDASPVDADALKAQIGSLGVIPAEMAALLSSDDFQWQLRYILQDCGLPEGTAERILERRDILLEKIREDAKYYEGKAPGYVEPGRIRVVPEAEMDAYHLEALAAAGPNGPFAALKNLPSKKKAELERKAEAAKAQGSGGRPVLQSFVPTARVIGSGLAQEPDPYGTMRPETLKLHIPVLGAQALSGNVNTRHPIGWEENGRMRKGIFTLPNIHSAGERINAILQPFRTDPRYAPYRDMIRAMEDYYLLSDKNKSAPNLPMLQSMPWSDLGISEERANELINDPIVKDIFRVISGKVMKQSMLSSMEDRIGAERGQRIEMRNVAMSDVGDALNVPNLLARAIPAKVELGGRIVDGVFMEEAEGIDLNKVKPGTAPAAIREDMNAAVFNTKGLKDLADLQILDYICMNRDRHGKNMFYKFADLETDHPKFLGVMGIDNDFSFSTEVPKDDVEISYLTKLNDIKVISASMAATIRDPALKERIAEKMRQNGLSDAQIKAAHDRLDKIKKKLGKGKLEVVQDDQWGKGKYRIETLGAGGRNANSSIFNIFKRTVIAPLNNMAAEHPVQPGHYLPIEELNVQPARKVDAFSDQLQMTAELQVLEKKAKEEFLTSAGEATKGGPRAENPEHQAIFNLHGIATALKAQLDAGHLPWPWGSGAYRKMHGACEDLLKFTGRLSEKLRENPDRELSEADSKKINGLIVDFNNKSVAYADYKRVNLQTHEAGRSTARRQSAAQSANEQMTAQYNAYKTARRERQKPLHLVHDKIRELQSGLGSLQGDALREKAAQIIYLNGLARMDLDKKSGMGVRRAMTAAKLAAQTERVMEQSAFKKLAQLPDSELRALAAGQSGTDLADRFIREIAKGQQAKNAPKPQGYQAPAHEPEQAHQGPIPQ